MAVPDFRIGFFDQLNKVLRNRLKVLAGSETPNGVRTVHPLPDWGHSGRTTFLLGRRLAWQHGVIRESVCSSVVIVEMNPRLITSWVVLLTRRMLRRPSILWGHAWSRSGSQRITNRLRLLMGSLGEVTVVYTLTQQAELIKRAPRRRIHAAPNAIAYERDISSPPSSERSQDFCYVGRLVAEKKPALLVDAWRDAVNDLAEGSLLHIVGDGPQFELLQARCVDMPSVRFHGHISNVDELRAIYSRCVASVSPGYVGLSVIQSLGFGVPMIIADKEPHSPEREAVLPDKNAKVFRSDSVLDLARALVDTQNDPYLSSPGCREQIARSARERYTYEAMAGAMLRAVLAASGGQR